MHEELTVKDLKFKLELAGAFTATVIALCTCLSAAGAYVWGPMIERAVVAFKDLIGQ